MQRRAAAVYLVLFVVLAGGAYAFIQVGATAPEVTLEAPEYEQNDTLSVDGRTYTVSKIDTSTTEEGEITYSGKLSWFNESNIKTAELANGSTVLYEGANYTVSIANETNVSSFTLVDAPNASAIVADDPNAERILTGDDGRQYVLFTDNSTQLLSEYLPPRETEGPFRVDETFPYPQENATIETTIDSVTPSAATLAWQEGTTQTISLSEGTNVTLNGQDYFVHFPKNDSVQVLPVDQYYNTYQKDLSDIKSYHERVAGLWGIVILSFLTGVILTATAYLPNKG